MKLSLIPWLLAASTLLAAETIPERALRGFGPVAAEFSEPGGKATVLQLTAASPEKAELWQAKYQSDLARTTGEVTERKIKGPGGEFTAFALPGDGGLYASVRNGAKLAIVYGKTESELLAALSRAGLTPTAENTVSSRTVPKYLDTYDQYAFRFYYWPGQTPPGTPSEEYDPQQEFDFAARLGNLGFVFWAEIHNADFAAGLLNENLWNWAYRLARQRDLPVVLNLSLANQPPIGNAFREDNVVRMPGYSGSFHAVANPAFGGTGTTSWASESARKAELQQLQKVLKRYGADEQVVDILEPHGELNHGDYTVFLEYGPLVDRSFREFLKERYGTLDAVSERYFGRPGAYQSWEQLRLPTIADFAGGGRQALDLAGEWRIGYLKLKPGAPKPGFGGLNEDRVLPAEPAPADFYLPGTDDSKWPLVRQMPGSDQTILLPKQPAVLRRHFQLPQKPRGRIWLYLWDLNQGTGDTVEVHLNGKQIAVDTVKHNVPHWGAYEVTDALKAGDNLLALRLPKGAIGYRVYLSPTEPRKYPFLPGHLNARWVDFSDWQGWSRNRAVELGISSIRELEPDKTIVSMSPAHYANQLRELARRFGTRFHDTGIMSVIFAEELPMLMRGADLPTSLEPGGPASDLPGFKLQTGLYTVSGLNAIHYFIHVGDIYWNAPIREYFQKILPALRQLGRQFQPKSDIAVLFDSDLNALQGYPWAVDKNTAYPSGYWNWRFNETLARDYPTDALTPADFANGLADRYRIILDANNTVMRPETVKGIEQWVRNGGIFVAMFETGRHTPEKPDDWPARQLTGFQSSVFSRYDDRGEPEKREDLTLAKGQKVFDAKQFPQWMPGDGVKLKGSGSDLETLWQWRDGSTAVGLRRLGKGYVVTFGVRLPWWEESTRRLLTDLLRWAEARPLELIAKAPLYPRHYVSSNGLYDIWVLWNGHREQTVPYRFTFRDGVKRELTDVLTGKPAPEAGELPPWEFKMVRSPRATPELAAREWFLLQRNRWQGTEKPQVTVNDREFPDYTRNTLPLEGEWEVRELAPGEKVETVLAEPGPWPKRELQVWLKDSEVKADHFLARRSFTVPKEWNDGEIQLWLTSQYLSVVIKGQLKIYLNGRQLAAPQPGHGVAHQKLDLKPGETATVALELSNRHPRLYGTQGSCFLAYLPRPQQEFDLAGEWEVLQGMNDPVGTKVKLPGNVEGNVMRRTVKLPAWPEGSRVYLYVEGEADILAALVNGHYVRRHHHRIGELTRLDVTPWLRSGEENELMLADWEENPRHHGWIRQVKLQIYHPQANH